jgi:hypothetical protein
MNQQRELLRNFYLHISLLHNLHTEQLLIDYNIQLFLNTYKGKKEKKEKPTKTNKKKNNSTNNETAPPENDIISELVTLANGTDYGTPTPTPTNATTEAPGAPIKEKRKYNRKPKVQNVNEALEVTTTDNVVVVEPVVEAPTEKQVKEKKPRKTKQPVANTEVQQVSDNNIVEAPAVVEAPAEKPVKEKKPRKSNKKLEGTEINL